MSVLTLDAHAVCVYVESLPTQMTPALMNAIASFVRAFHRHEKVVDHLVEKDEPRLSKWVGAHVAKLLLETFSGSFDIPYAHHQPRRTLTNRRHAFIRGLTRLKKQRREDTPPRFWDLTFPDELL